MAGQNEVAAHLDLSQQAVSQMLAAGILPAGGRGRLDLVACRVAYIRHLRGVAAGRASASGDDDLDLVAERARLAKEQADRLAMQNDMTRGAVVPVAEVAAVVGAEYARVRTRLLAIPAEQAPRIHRCKAPAEVMAVLLEVISEALEELTRDGDGGPSSR